MRRFVAIIGTTLACAALVAACGTQAGPELTPRTTDAVGGGSSLRKVPPRAAITAEHVVDALLEEGLRPVSFKLPSRGYIVVMAGSADEATKLSRALDEARGARSAASKEHAVAMCNAVYLPSVGSLVEKGSPQLQEDLRRACDDDQDINTHDVMTALKKQLPKPAADAGTEASAAPSGLTRAVAIGAGPSVSPSSLGLATVLLFESLDGAEAMGRYLSTQVDEPDEVGRFEYPRGVCNAIVQAGGGITNPSEHVSEKQVIAIAERLGIACAGGGGKQTVPMRPLTPRTDALDRRRDVKSYDCRTGTDLALSELPDKHLSELSTLGVPCDRAAAFTRKFAARRDCQLGRCTFDRYSCSLVPPEDHHSYADAFISICRRRDKARRLVIWLSFLEPTTQRKQAQCRAGDTASCPK